VVGATQVKGCVENLWMVGENPVDRSTINFFLRESPNRSSKVTIVHVPSSIASLDPKRPIASESSAHPNSKTAFAPTLVANVVHRFEESIAGQAYLIEAALVSQDRWRACIVRIPGVPTALMPFYGRTPDEAARNLTDWLTRAHQRAAGKPPR
jgi:hypothetical protein